MAATTVQPNNATVAFRGKAQREPASSLRTKADRLLRRGLLSQKQHGRLIQAIAR